MQLYTNASGLHSWGTYWSGRWLQSHWSPKQRLMNIAWKELFAILVAVHTWGTYWARKKILFHCDNQSLVNIRGKGSTPDPQIMALIAKFCQLAPAAQPTPDLIPTWPTESFTSASCNATIVALPPPSGTHTNLASQASDTSAASTTSCHCQQLH